MPKDMPKDAVVGAGIDVGSNSIRLIISTIGPEGITPLLKKRFTPRLGEEVARTGRLSPSFCIRYRIVGRHPLELSALM